MVFVMACLGKYSLTFIRRQVFGELPLGAYGGVDRVKWKICDYPWRQRG